MATTWSDGGRVYLSIALGGDACTEHWLACYRWPGPEDAVDVDEEFVDRRIRIAEKVAEELAVRWRDLSDADALEALERAPQYALNEPAHVRAYDAAADLFDRYVVAGTAGSRSDSERELAKFDETIRALADDYSPRERVSVAESTEVA